MNVDSSNSLKIATLDIGGGTSDIMRDIIAKIIIDGKDYEAETSKI